MIRLNRLFLMVAGSVAASAIFACGDVATAPQDPEFAFSSPIAAFTSCRFQPYEARSRIIGRSGGKLSVGGHVLIVPPGALDANTLITMESPAGTMRRVTFGPEGLTFRAEYPAHLIMSYRTCSVPPGSDQKVVYVNESLSILETTPSVSDPATLTVDSKLAHFSDYVLLSTYAVVY